MLCDLVFGNFKLDGSPHLDKFYPNQMTRNLKHTQPVRIQKILADRGLASRREAEIWIADGRVTVNGQTAQLGDKAIPLLDTIAVDDKSVPKRTPPALTIAIHKPKGVLSTNEDPHGGRTVFDLLPPELRAQRLFCVGRLDKESEGLLLLTNDGDLRQKISHPSHGIAKVYEVRLNKPLASGIIPKLRKGILWEGERLCADKVFPRKQASGEDWQNLEITLRHGKKREIRRLFYAFDYDVRRLKRVLIGGYRLHGIPRGQFRILAPRDIQRLFSSPSPPPRTRQRPH